MSILLGVDIGTSTTRALAYDPVPGRVIALARRPTPVSHPLPEWSEHEPEMLWQSVVACLRAVAASLAPERHCALAISSFGEPAVPLDSDMHPLFPMQAWYDRRCEAQLAMLEAHLSPVLFYTLTGQRLSTAPGLVKWLWFRQQYPDLAARTALILPAASYILWRLTGQRFIDYTIAARTGLFDARALDWSPNLLELAGLAPQQLPSIVPPGTRVGALTAEAAAYVGLPVGMTCVTGGHDHLCAALAAGALEPGVVVDSTGTAEALLLVTDRFRTEPALISGGYTCSPGFAPGSYLLRGGLASGGASLTWLARQFAPPGTPEEALPYAELEAEGTKTAGRVAGPLWLPHLSGSGTPLNDRQSMAAVVGLRAEHGRGDLFRGLLEAQAFWLKYNLDTCAEITGQKVERLLLLGGLTRIELLTRLKATVLPVPLLVPAFPEPAALGTALLAGVGADAFPDPTAAQASLRYPFVEAQPWHEYIPWYRQLYEEVFLSLYAALQPVQRGLTAMAKRDVFSSGALL